MRSNKQIEDIKKYQSPPKQIFDFLTQGQIQDLLDYYKRCEFIDVKPTGPKCAYLSGNEIVLKSIVNKLKEHFGNFKIRNAQIFDTSVPHALHNDDGKDFPITYKAFNFPLYVETGVDTDAKLCMFDQYYYGGPAKFFKGENITQNTYNAILTEYSKIQNKSNKLIEKETKQKYLSHLEDKWLDGMSIQKIFDWKIGSCIAFDALQIHCASNFKNAGINSKIGLSIFTVIE